jgi:hypothetical protein
VDQPAQHCSPCRIYRDSAVDEYSKGPEKYNATRYSIDDCRSWRSVTEYLANLESAAKACGQGLADGDVMKFGLVIQAWMHLDLPLRETVDEPAPDTSLGQFASTLLRK